MEIERFVVVYGVDGKSCRLETPVGEDASGPGLRVVFDRRPAVGGFRLRVELNAMAAIDIEECRLEAACPIDPSDRIFCNGFQSWTDSRSFLPHETMPKLRVVGRALRLHRFGDAHFFPYDGRPGRLHGHTYAWVGRDKEHISLAGSLNESNGYTLFVFHAGQGGVNVEKDCQGMRIAGRCRVFDLLLLSGPPGQVFDRYFGLMDRACPPGKPRSGWTSWYLHYTKISEKVILENLAAFSSRQIPLDLFQIDDGFQKAVGDWLVIKPTFPRGMAPLATAIHDAGYSAGLWLAPFVCEKRSELFARHPDWLLCDADGQPVPAGWNPTWSGTFYALDLYNPQFREYLKEVFATVLNCWGFDMVKLDFLYAAAMTPRKGRSRGGVMGDAMAFLSQSVGDRLLLGCGVPLGAAFGQVDYCRIGADVAPVWEDHRLRWLRYRERVSTVNSLTSTIGRHHLDGRAFGNDPDVFILRSHDNRMSADQRHTLFLINNLFGSLVFTSDDISRYGEVQMALLLSMFPVRAKKILKVTEDRGILAAVVRIGDLGYRVLANLSEEPCSVFLDPGQYFTTTEGFVQGDAPVLLNPFASRCYLKIGDRTPGVAGSTIHLFPGSEVAAVALKGDRIDVRLHERACGKGTVWVRVPTPGPYLSNGVLVDSIAVLPGVETVAVAFTGEDNGPQNGRDDSR
ncbi:MAG: alpha-galactosidase [Desulfobacterales bacterium]|nr:alpha-galactosidase [Desulfobacterales bacterium]